MTEKFKKKKKNISLGNFIKNIAKHFLSCFHFNFGRFNFGEPGEKLNCQSYHISPPPSLPTKYTYNQFSLLYFPSTLFSTKLNISLAFPLAKLGIYVKILLLSSQFVFSLFHFGMSQNIVLFLKIKIINLLMFLLYPYFIFKTI